MSAQPSTASLQPPSFGFERFREEQKRLAGNMISRGRSAKGMVYSTGPYKGLTVNQAEEAMRKQYESMGDSDRRSYESGAEGNDVMSDRDLSKRDAYYEARDAVAGGGQTGTDRQPDTAAGPKRVSPSYQDDGGTGFSTRQKTWSGLRTEDEVAARIHNNRLANPGVRRAVPVGAGGSVPKLVEKNGMSTAESEEYRQRAISQGFGSARVVSPDEAKTVGRGTINGRPTGEALGEKPVAPATIAANQSPSPSPQAPGPRKIGAVAETTARPGPTAAPSVDASIAAAKAARISATRRGPWRNKDEAPMDGKILADSDAGKELEKGFSAPVSPTAEDEEERKRKARRAGGGAISANSPEGQALEKTFS